MADVPLTLAIPAATLLTGAIGTLFGLLIKAKNGEKNAWKSIAKQAIRGRRYARVELEQIERGAPSVPPPPLRDEESYDDDTGVHEAMAREDERYFEERQRLRILPGLPEIPPLAAFEDHRSREERQRNERDRTLRKFVSDGESTPPEPLSPGGRKKLPSRGR